MNRNLRPPWNLLTLIESYLGNRTKEAEEVILSTLQLIRDSQEGSESFSVISELLIGFQSEPEFIVTGIPMALGKSLRREIEHPNNRGFYIPQRQGLVLPDRQRFSVVQSIEKVLVEKSILNIDRFKYAWSITSEDDQTYNAIPPIEAYLEAR